MLTSFVTAVREPGEKQDPDGDVVSYDDIGREWSKGGERDAEEPQEPQPRTFEASYIPPSEPLPPSAAADIVEMIGASCFETLSNTINPPSPEKNLECWRLLHAAAGKRGLQEEAEHGYSQATRHMDAVHYLYEGAPP